MKKKALVILLIMLSLIFLIQLLYFAGDKFGFLTSNVIIELSEAGHLDDNRNFIDNVYEFVMERDSNFVNIPAGDYLRVNFHKNLTKDNDIIIYARSDSNAEVDVYEKNSEVMIASFGVISEDREYKVYLTGLEGEQDGFDLLVKNGNVEFDYVIDPAGSYAFSFISPTPENNSKQTATSVAFKANIEDAADLAEVKYSWNGTNYSLYDDSLLLLLNFDNVAVLSEDETHVTDVSRYANNGTLRGGAVWSPSGKYDGTFNFSDSLSQAINITPVVPFNSSKLTISYWLFPKDLSDNAGQILFMNKNAFSDAYGFEIYLVNSNLNIRGSSSTAATFTNFYNGYINTWVHTTLVFDGTSISVYRNGAYVGSGTITALTGLGTHHICVFGYGLSCWDYNFDGSIDNLMIWNRSLTTPEIYGLYTSNLNKYDGTSWHAYVNHSKNATAVLEYGEYAYQLFAKDISGDIASSESRTIFLQSDITPPIFSDYWDNNFSLVDSGIGLFNVTIENTNGTVFLEINNTNITATNFSSNVYNASYAFTASGSYTYKWHSWGNGTYMDYNASEERFYDLRGGCDCPGANQNWEINTSENCILSNECNLSFGNITFVGTGAITFNSTVYCKSIGSLADGQVVNIGSDAYVVIG